MTTCTIRPETDGYPELVERVEEIADRVVPALEDVIQLPVGPAPLIRLVSPDTLVTEVIGDQRRAVHRDIAAFGLGEDEAGVLEQKLASREEWLGEFWMFASGYTLDNVEGRPEILMVPDAIHHSGMREPGLTQTLAMELCHVARHRAGQGALHRVHDSPCPVRHGCLPGAYPAFAISGFGAWAASEVALRLLGDPVVPGQTGYEGSEYTQALGALDRRVQEQGIVQPGTDTVWLPAWSDFPIPPPVVYEEGARWAAEVVRSTGGVELLNRMWAHPAIFPALAEIADSKLWVDRARQSADSASRRAGQ